MGYKNPEEQRDYQRNKMRERRKAAKEKESSSTHIEPKSTDYEPKAAGVLLKEEEEIMKSRIDGQVHLLSGSMGVFRSPQVVFDMARRLLLSQGWCVFRYPTLENETFVIMNGKIPPKIPPPKDLPILTLNPDRTIEVELQMNIPGSINSN